jgi:hypothetical protein
MSNNDYQKGELAYHSDEKFSPTASLKWQRGWLGARENVIEEAEIRAVNQVLSKLGLDYEEVQLLIRHFR